MPEHDEPMADPMDQRLRSASEQWRATLPAPPALARPAVGDARTGSRTPAPRWYAAAAVAAVVVLVVGISAGVAVLGRGDHRALPPSAPSPSASASISGSATATGAVPWVALSATHPSLPSTTTPPSPDPADAAGLRPCGAHDLHASTGPGDGAGGTLYRRIVLTLIGTDPCRLSGYPTVEPLDHGRRLDLQVEHQSSLDALFERPVAVAPARPAVITVAWAVSHSCPSVDNDAIRFTLPGIAAPFAVAGFGRSFCNPGEGRSPIIVGPVHPQAFIPARVRSPYDGLRASGELPSSAHAGKPVDFAVTLTSKRDLPLEPCPDYTITVAGAQAQRASYALNCGAIPHRDAQGRPYLPAGVPVTFAMQAPPITTSPSKLMWQLDTPSETGAADLGGVVTLAP